VPPDPDSGVWSPSSLTAINNSGVAIGQTDVFTDAGDYQAGYAVRWASGAAEVLPPLGTGAMPDFLTRIASEARSMNSRDTIVGQAYRFSEAGAFLGRRPARWDSGVATQLDTIYQGSEREGAARGINEAGLIFGEYVVSGQLYACAWDEGQFIPIGAPGGGENQLEYSTAIAVNEAGLVVGWGRWNDPSGESPGGTTGYTWQAGTFSKLPALGADAFGEQSWPRDVNSSGLIGGSGRKFDAAGNSLGLRGVLWQDGSIVAELEALGADSRGTGLSEIDEVFDNGWAIGSAEMFDASGAYRGRRGLAWVDGSTTFFDFPELNRADGYNYTSVVSNDNWGFALVSTEVYEDTTAIGRQLFLWSPGESLRPFREFINGGLGPDEWTDLSIQGISDNGLYLAGVATNAFGQREGVILMVPEPGGAELGLLGTLLMVLFSRKRPLLVVAKDWFPRRHRPSGPMRATPSIRPATLGLRCSLPWRAGT